MEYVVGFFPHEASLIKLIVTDPHVQRMVESDLVPERYPSSMQKFFDGASRFVRRP